MLSRKFGKEVANYFSGNPLHRVGFLRSDHTFLSQALRHPSTSFLLCNDLQPLVAKNKSHKLAYVKYADIKAIIGEDPYGPAEKDLLDIYDSRTYVPQMIFLGIDEKAPEGDGALSFQSKNKYTGAPYFALDVTPRDNSVKQACQDLIKDVQSKGYEFAKGRVMDVEAADGTYLST